MEVKKNSKQQVEKNSGLYFLIGLSAVLALVYFTIEWKTYYSKNQEIAMLSVIEELNDSIPITKHKLPDPPKPKIKTPEIIEVIDDEEDLEESVIESDEVNQDTEIADVGDIEVATDDEPEIIPFSVIEDVPVFPGCENAKDQRQCFQEMMQKHVRKNFKYPELAQEIGLQGRVSVLFVIQKDGTIGNVRMRGPHKSLEKEASRIISMLPRMTPGKQRGNPVKVPFAIPIVFKLQ
ncbi:MAG: energy transducer TonB [Bacteroidota bacterium]